MVISDPIELRTKMQNEKLRVTPKHPFDLEIIEKQIDSEIKDYDCRQNTNSIESTVIWSGKDSESKSIEYLEECNTHQNGE